MDWPEPPFKEDVSAFTSAAEPSRDGHTCCRVLHPSDIFYFGCWRCVSRYTNRHEYEEKLASDF